MEGTYDFGSVKLAVNVRGTDKSCKTGGSYICPSPESLDACGKASWSCVTTSYKDAGAVVTLKAERMSALEAELADLLKKHLG